MGTTPRSPYCPDCGGSGMTVKYGFGVPCQLCKANQLGNVHLKSKDLKNQAYMESWITGEKSPLYWLWLKLMVNNGYIKTDKPKKKRGKK